MDYLVLSHLADTYTTAAWAAAWPDRGNLWDYDLVWRTRQEAETMHGHRRGIRYYFHDHEKGWVAASP